MGSMQQIKSLLLNDGRITASEVEMIKDHMARDGKLDFEDAQLLIELVRDAKEVCSEFDEFFFPCLRHIIL